MLDRSVKSGSYLTAPGRALIGAGIAKDLGFKVGDTLKVVTEKADYGLGFKRFKIAGIFATDVNALDGNIFQIGLDDARELLGAEGGSTQILVMLSNYRHSEPRLRRSEPDSKRPASRGSPSCPGPSPAPSPTSWSSWRRCSPGST
jgi:ABC-type lipoprotein release transport system permease subunit